MTAEPEFEARIDGLIAAVLRGEKSEWPAAWSETGAHAKFIDRATFHGVAGLLLEADRALLPWPEPVVEAFRAEAIQRAMWEMRHRLVLSDLLTALADRGVLTILLKGTALAYDLYERPASRARGDTDLLVEAGYLTETREVLTGLGFVRNAAEASDSDEFLLQEVWSFDSPDGTVHHIDLHWQAMNSPALEDVLLTAECMASPLELPRLCNAARTMDRVIMLIHVMLHRAAHITTPIVIGGSSYLGGDRLIWAQDIARLAGALSNGEWSRFCELSLAKGIARVCLDGLNLAHRQLGTSIPDWVVAALEAAPERQPASTYLLESGPLARGWQDLLAMRGFTVMLSYLASRILPSGAFMRANYPGMAGRPLAWLYLRRVAGLLRRRPGRTRS